MKPALEALGYPSSEGEKSDSLPSHRKPENMCIKEDSLPFQGTGPNIEASQFPDGKNEVGRDERAVERIGTNDRGASMPQQGEAALSRRSIEVVELPDGAADGKGNVLARDQSGNQAERQPTASEWQGFTDALLSKKPFESAEGNLIDLLSSLDNTNESTTTWSLTG